MAPRCGTRRWRAPGSLLAQVSHEVGTDEGSREIRGRRAGYVGHPWLSPGVRAPLGTPAILPTSLISCSRPARIGEILARRWSDLDLGTSRPILAISGTLVYIKGKGAIRQDWTKSEAGYRTIVLPGFAVGTLLARKITAAEKANDAVFASRRSSTRRPTPRAPQPNWVMAVKRSPPPNTSPSLRSPRTTPRSSNGWAQTDRPLKVRSRISTGGPNDRRPTTGDQ